MFKLIEHIRAPFPIFSLSSDNDKTIFLGGNSPDLLIYNLKELKFSGRHKLHENSIEKITYYEKLLVTASHKEFGYNLKISTYSENVIKNIHGTNISNKPIQSLLAFNHEKSKGVKVIYNNQSKLYYQLPCDNSYELKKTNFYKDDLKPKMEIDYRIRSILLKIKISPKIIFPIQEKNIAHAIELKQHIVLSSLVGDLLIFKK